MNDNFNNRNEINDGKGKSKSFWKFVGYMTMAIVLAVITVFVLNLNR